MRRGARSSPRRRKIRRGRGEGLEGVAERPAAASPAGVGGRRRRRRGAAEAATGGKGGAHEVAADPAVEREMPRRAPTGLAPAPRAARRGPPYQKRRIPTSRRPDAHAPQGRTRAFTAATVWGGGPCDALLATARSAPCFRHGAAAMGQDAVQAAAGPLPPRAGRQAACGRVQCPRPARARKARPRRCAGRGHCNRRRIPPGHGASSNALLRECAYI